MIFNRYFWFSVFLSVIAQSVQWRPALAEELFPEPQHADWICYHAGSSVRTYGRKPSIEKEAPVLREDFTRWASLEFEKKLDRALR